MKKYKITITIDATYGALDSVTDSHLVGLWHVAQANPASLDSPEAGEVAELVGREIIRRFIQRTEPELWHHQGRHYSWDICRKHGKWVDGVWVLNPIEPDSTGEQL